MNEARVPKWLRAYPDEIAWAFRHGIVSAMRSQGRHLPKQPGAAVIADRRVLMLADRVRRIWLRRHPLPRQPWISTDPAPTYSRLDKLDGLGR